MRVRDFLRRMDYFEFAKRRVAEFFKVSDRKALAILRELATRSWIDPVPQKKGTKRGI